MSDTETEQDEKEGTGPDWAWDFAHPLEQRGFSSLVRAASNDKDAGTTLFVASTPTPDRAMDVVASSWKLAAFKSNPVILDNHNSLRVVGTSIDTYVARAGEDAGKLLIRVKWDLDSPDPAVRNVGHQHLSGIRRAGSVGFRSKKKTQRSQLPKDHPHFQEPIEVETWWGKEKVSGWLYEDNELMEFSSASIPMNPEALQRSLGLGPQDDRKADPGAVHDFRQWLEDATNRNVALDLLMPALVSRLRSDADFRRIVRAVAESDAVPVPNPVPTQPQPRQPGPFSQLLTLLES